MANSQSKPDAEWKFSASTSWPKLGMSFKPHQAGGTSGARLTHLYIAHDATESRPEAQDRSLYPIVRRFMPSWTKPGRGWCLYIPWDLTLLPEPDQPNGSVKPELANGESKTLYVPDYVFLIEHTATEEKYIFDLGMRKDLENLPPRLKELAFQQLVCEPRSPAEILQEHGSPEQQPDKIKAVIFSHLHFDHVGDGAQAGFGEAQIWIGPTSCMYARPGYPVDPGAFSLTDTLPTDGSRKIVEAYIPDDVLKAAGDKRAGRVQEGMLKGLYKGTDLKKPDWISLGAFDRAFDVFGDGSAYIIDAPGHSAGHQMMLVRTTSAGDDSTFVLLAGDCFHHPNLLQDPRRTARPPYSKLCMHEEPGLGIETIWRTRKFAERDEVWVIGAHDYLVGDAIEKGVKELQGLVEISDWREKNWKNSLS